MFDEDVDGGEIIKVYEKEGIAPGEMSGVGDDDENFESG